MKIDKVRWYRNIPFIDTKGFGFFFQKSIMGIGRYYFWVEVPFFAVHFRCITK